MRERILIVDDDPLERRLSIAAAYRRPLSCVQYLHRCVAQQGFAGTPLKLPTPEYCLQAHRADQGQVIWLLAMS